MKKEDHPQYSNFREEMFENQANGRTDLNCTFQDWLVRQDKLANLFDELMAEQGRA
jgi:hypothetical protein